MELFFRNLLIYFALLIIGCNAGNDDSTYKDELEKLNILKAEIEALADTSICNTSFECKYIAFGSKPCGGPWSYLIYSTSIDTDQLETLTENYNQKNVDFNEKWDVVSDCSLALPPVSFNCENNSCIPIY